MATHTQKSQTLSFALRDQGMIFDSACPNVVSSSGADSEAKQLMLGERSPRGVKYEVNARYGEEQAPFVVLMTTLNNLFDLINQGRPLNIWHSNDVPGVPSCFCVGG